MDDLPRRFVIRESSHRIHNPFTSEKLATLGRALYLSPGTSVLDLACGSGEMLCTWARDHRLTGTGVDISTAFIGAARARAIELDVADRVTFIHGDAAGYVAERPVGVASCEPALPCPGQGRAGSRGITGFGALFMCWLLFQKSDELACRIGPGGGAGADGVEVAQGGAGVEQRVVPAPGVGEGESGIVPGPAGAVAVVLPLAVGDGLLVDARAQ